jgi:hypothetical protein
MCNKIKCSTWLPHFSDSLESLGLKLMIPIFFSLCAETITDYVFIILQVSD